MIASYYYDPFGRRLWKEVAGVRTYFHYSDEGLIGEYDSTGNEIKTYGYKPGSTWTTDPLFMKEGSSYYFYQNDHLGTPQKMTAVNGAVVWAAKYSSFGEASVDAASTVTNNLRVPGQYYDGETGLHYNYHRYYDPETGRYLKPDPLGLRGGLNLFQYALSNPIVKYDQYGLAVTTVDAFCRRYPKACKELFPKHPVPVPILPPLPIEIDEPDGYSSNPDDYLPNEEEWKQIEEQPEKLDPYEPGGYEQCINRCKLNRCEEPIMRKLCYLKCAGVALFEIITGG